MLAAARDVWAVVNWTYQVIRKPTELFFPVSVTLYKTPAETWDAYAHLFRRHATDVITPGVPRGAGAGGGLGQPGGAHLLALVVAASIRSSCIDRHPARWGCTRSRTAPSRRRSATASTITSSSRKGPGTPGARAGSTSSTSAWCRATRSSSPPRFSIARCRRRWRGTGSRRATPTQKQRLAALIHLCGAGAGNRYARGGLALDRAALRRSRRARLRHARRQDEPDVRAIGGAKLEQDVVVQRLPSRSVPARKRSR